MPVLVLGDAILAKGSSRPLRIKPQNERGVMMLARRFEVVLCTPRVEGVCVDVVLDGSFWTFPTVPLAERLPAPADPGVNARTPHALAWVRGRATVVAWLDDAVNDRDADYLADDPGLDDVLVARPTDTSGLTEHDVELLFRWAHQRPLSLDARGDDPDV